MSGEDSNMSGEDSNIPVKQQFFDAAFDMNKCVHTYYSEEVNRQGTPQTATETCRPHIQRMKDLNIDELKDCDDDFSTPTCSRAMTEYVTNGVEHCSAAVDSKRGSSSQEEVDRMTKFCEMIQTMKK